MRKGILERHDRVCRAIGEGIRRIVKQPTKMRTEVSLKVPGSTDRPKRADVIVRAGLVEFLAEISVTNQEAIRTIKRGQLESYLALRTAQRMATLKVVGEDTIKGYWRNLGSDAVLIRLEKSNSGGINVAACEQCKRVWSGHVEAGEAPRGKGALFEKSTRDFMKKHVKVILKDCLAGGKKPLRVILFVSGAIADGARRWLAELKFPVQGVVLPSIGSTGEAAWGDQMETGSGARALAKAFKMEWPEAGMQARVKHPISLQTRPILALFDTSGTAYPETVRSFQEATGGPLPKEVGATVILAVDAIFRMWRRKARLNRGRARKATSRRN